MKTNVETDFRAWDKLLAKIGGLVAGDAEVKVGVFGGGQMAELAAIHEYGAPRAGIPERSFIRRTFIVKRRETAAMASALAKRIVVSPLTVEQAMGQLGAWGAAQVKNTITAGAGVPPPLKAATIAARARKRKSMPVSTRPLVDYGNLLQSITWAVG